MPWTLFSTRNETVQIARGGWLDALRFIVAFLIILHHFQAAGPAPLAEIVNPVFERGGFLLTNFFLIDSGYVLMRVYGAAVEKGRMSPGDFFLKRFLRVVPAHLMMGLALVALWVVPAAVTGGAEYREAILWTQSAGRVTEAELASVIAHELGHVTHGHARRRMMDFAGQSVLRTVLAGGFGRIIPIVGPMLAGLVASALAARLSREDEYQADAFAAALMAKGLPKTKPQQIKQL